MNVSGTKQASGWGKLIAALVLAVVAMFLQALAMIPFMMLVEGGGYTTATITVGEVAGGVIVTLFVLALGGRALLRNTQGGFGFACRAAAVVIVVDLLIFAITLLGAYLSQDTNPISWNWPLNVCLVAVLCAGVGVYEEGTFRGLVLHGLLARMGTGRAGVTWALVLSSLVFGAAHVLPSGDFSPDALSLAQTVLKALQAGMLGFIFGTITLRTRSLLPSIALHALNDFLLLFVDMGLWEMPLSTDYVTTGESAFATMVLYGILCLVYLPSAIYCARRLRELPVPDRGQFYRARKGKGTPTPPAPPLAQPAMPTASTRSARPEGYPIPPEATQGDGPFV